MADTETSATASPRRSVDTANHDFRVQDEAGRRLGGGRLPEGIEGITRFHELAADNAARPGEVVIGIETERGPYAQALVAARYQVFAVDPLSGSRYRDRYPASGAKSGPGMRGCWPAWSASTGTTTSPARRAATWPRR